MARLSAARATIHVVAVTALTSACHSVDAVDKSEVRAKWHTPYDLYLSPREAYDMMVADPGDVLLIDIRTRAEIQFTGFTDVADAHIPAYTYSGEWKPAKDGVHGSYRKLFNFDFVGAIDNLVASKGKDQSVPIILMCASGTRSPVAAEALHDAGYRKVYVQVEGFEGAKAKQGPDKGKRVVNGWKNAGLPWGYDLKTEKMYFNFVPTEQR